MLLEILLNTKIGIQIAIISTYTSTYYKIMPLMIISETSK